MKKAYIAFIILFAVIPTSFAAERRPLEAIDSDEFTQDTQVPLKGAGDNHVAIAWWIPNEFWQAIFTRDSTIAQVEKEAMLEVISGVSLMAVVQADITAIGAFRFYSKEEIAKNMTLSYTEDAGKELGITPMQKISPDLELLLGIFKPILGAAMGNLGNNLHFYVLDDNSVTSSRLLDPYQAGLIYIQLVTRDGVSIDASIETPINALFIPRKCPNGKEAHVTWKYCPWSGKPLPE